MGQKSKLAELGVLNILNQMKNPLTNIRLCIELIENGDKTANHQDCHEIIRNSAVALENSIRDLCKSFDDLGVSIHIEKERLKPADSFKNS